MIQGLEKLLFIQMWLTPHHFKRAVLIMLMAHFVFCLFFLPQSASYICSGRMSSVRWDRSEPPDTVGALPQKALPPETPKIRRLLSKVPSAGIHWLRWYLLSTAPAILSMSFFVYHTPNTYSLSIQP